MNLNKWRSFFIDEEKQEPKYTPELSLIDERLFHDLDMTYLTESEILMLMEGRKENIIRRYEGKISPESLESMLNFDEQYRYKHLGWMASKVAEKENDWQQDEMTQTAIAAVQSFVRYQQNMKQRDINQYNTVSDLLDAIQADVIQPRIDKARTKRMAHPETQRQLERQQATVVYEDERYFVVRPNTSEASCHFGSRTRWCIAQTGNSYFNSYTEGQGKVFYFIKDDTKRNEDYNYKMALQAALVGGEPQFEMIWDRDDNSTDIPLYSAEENLYELASVLESEFEMPQEKAEAIAMACTEHLADYAPASPVAALVEKVNAGEYNGGYLQCGADYDEDGEYTYLYISANVEIKYMIKSSAVIEMLNNDQIDIFQAELEIYEAFKEDEYMYKKLDDEVDIGASKYWWPNEDNTSEPVEVDISGAEDQWYITIRLNNFTDPDNPTYYTQNKDEAESFLEYMKEEWGERNETEIEEVLDNHILRLIPEVAESQASAFIELKRQFSTGEHELLDDRLWYSVDDEEDEMSDLNLFMDFQFALSEEYLTRTLDVQTMEPDAPSNPFGEPYVYAANALRGSSARGTIKGLLVRAIKEDLFGTRDNTGQEADAGNMYRAIYNVYERAREFADRQLQLDFGPDFALEEPERTLPEIPAQINSSIYLGSDTISLLDDILSSDISSNPGYQGGTPKGGIRTGTSLSGKTFISRYMIVIPFHHSEAELKEMMNFFLFIRDNYDQIHSYLHKYYKQYANIHGSRRSPEGMIAENLMMDILESQFYLSELEEEMYLYEKKGKKRKAAKKKRRKKKKKKKAKRDACYHKVRARYDVWPSAYASGALVKCRKVGAANWGNKSKTNEEIEQELELDTEFLKEVEDLLENTEQIDEKKKKRKKRKLTSKPSSETSLRDWFGRRGAKGKKKGWVDCNAPDGKGGYKSCGRSDGEKRKKYPACRPTPGACKKMKGSKGKSWGKKGSKKRGKKK